MTFLLLILAPKSKLGILTYEDKVEDKLKDEIIN